MSKPYKKEPKKTFKTRVSVTMTWPYVKALDQLVEAGVYRNRGEIVLEALRRFLKDYDIELPYWK